MEKKANNFRAKLYELWSRLTPIKMLKNEEIYFNGSDNLYPYEVEGVVNSSPTAFKCAELMATYISGKGIREGFSDPIVNSRKNYKLSNIIELMAADISVHYGVWLHIGRKISEEGKIVVGDIDVVDYVKCRKVKEDAADYAGKIIVKDWIKEKESPRKRLKDTDIKWYYPFNNNIDVITSQIAADSDNEENITEAIKDYRGQILYLNLTPKYEYALSRLDSVYNDADSEGRFGIYTNNQFRNGFLGKTIAVTSGLDEENSKQVGDDLSKMLGAENSGDFYYMSVDSVDKIENTIKFIQLQPEFNDKLFDSTSTRLKKNIMGAYKNVPEILIAAGDGALFGANSETYVQAKLFYSEQVEKERYRIIETLQQLDFVVDIQPIIEVESSTIENKEEGV